MSFKYLHITLGTTDQITLQFELANNPLTALWVERMAAKEQYPLDDPTRFYGFNLPQEEEQRAVQMIQNCISAINQHYPIIEREFTHAGDQDCLNYLHNIFERYHGLLDQQTHDFWTTAPASTRQALSDLNVAVHRCESLRTNNPRVVCTWFGLPKSKTLTFDLLNTCGTTNLTFGGVYLNYVEIGKTLLDLATDNDNYIADDAFKPFDHYSADFVVRFYTQSPEEITTTIDNMRTYYNQHIPFFHKHGLTTFEDPRLQPLHFMVANLIETMPREQLMYEIQQRQYISEVYFT